MNTKNYPILLILLILCGAILGIVSVVIPPMFIVEVESYEAPLFPSVSTGIEGLSAWALFFLFLSGLALGVIYSKRLLLLGFSTIFLFPLLAFSEMIVEQSSHNLWPIEFVVYFFMAFPGILGAYVGGYIRFFLKKKETNISKLN